MPFAPDDAQLLLRSMNGNQTVLFLGAGFARDVVNRAGVKFPLSKELAESIWGWLRYEEPYDGTSVGEMYQALLGSGKTFAEITSLVAPQLQADTVPETYSALSIPYWRRIYTTNVDNILEVVWRGARGQSLDPLVYPRDDMKERDQFLSRLQVVHLHGKLPCRPDELTFTPRQYAKRSVMHDPLYEQFLRDYTTTNVVFLGTELNEPLFYQYLEARQQRGQVPSEHRPRCFLVSPSISEPRRRNLADLNITAVKATTSDFLAWIIARRSELWDLERVLKSIAPTYGEVLRASREPDRDQDIRSFAQAFHQVPLQIQGGPRRSQYLLGASPLWEDLLQDLDAPRTLTNELVGEVTAALDGAPRLAIHALLGSAGCGKSTILRRAGLALARAGRQVFLTNSEEIPRSTAISRALESLEGRAALLFDNAEGAIGILPALVKELSSIEHPPVVIVASRRNEFDRRIGRLPTDCNLREWDVPHLDDVEITGVINRLESNNLLGKLRGMTPAERFREFKVRSGQQILVAMREATTGRRFDEILVDEFSGLPTLVAKRLYLCTALAADAGYRIRKDELIGCSDDSPAASMYALERSLRDIVIQTGSSGDLLLLRHRRIAEFMVDEGAPRALLADAYVALLSVLAGEVTSADRHSRTFLFYRELINHSSIFSRFSRSIGDARAIYQSLAPKLSRDPQFWLQYGSLELEGDSLELAENYLQQAKSLDPKNRHTQTAIGHLRLRQALAADDRHRALNLRDEGCELLETVIANSGDAVSPHPFHVLVSQRLGWIRQWAIDNSEKKHELGSLRTIAGEASRRFPRSGQLRKLADDVERDYLRLAVVS